MKSEIIQHVEEIRMEIRMIKLFFLLSIITLLLIRHLMHRTYHAVLLQDIPAPEQNPTPESNTSTTMI